MTTEQPIPRPVEPPRYSTPPSLADHMRTCTSNDCLRCAGGNLPHFGLIR